MVSFLEDTLKRIGLRVEIFASEDGKKANVFATLGPVDRGGLMLSGHMDVVPVEGQAWVSDPFALLEQDDKLYGRGTADMKSFIVQAIHVAEAMRHKKFKLPVNLAFTYDEEVGCGGAVA